jgi:hypothetical protein
MRLGASSRAPQTAFREQAWIEQQEGQLNPERRKRGPDAVDRALTREDVAWEALEAL